MPTFVVWCTIFGQFWFVAVMAYRQNQSGYSSSRKWKGGRKSSSSSSWKKRRVSKKSSGSSGKSNVRALQKIVREEAAHLMRGPTQKVTVMSFPAELKFWSQSELSKYAYFRVPVTQAIPLRRGAGVDDDDRYRRGNEVYVKGVCVRMLVSYAVSVGVMGVCYPAKVQDEAIEVLNEPATSFLLGTKEGDACRLLTLEETRFADSKDAPFNVVRGSDGLPMLDSPDQSLFNCRLAKGAGAPVGEARWRVEKNGEIRKGRSFAAEFHVSGNMRTRDWGAPGGYTQMDTRVVEVYWEIDKKIEFVAEMSRQPVFEHHLELMFGVQGLGVYTGADYGKDCAKPVDGGCVSNVMVDVYYA